MGSGLNAGAVSLSLGALSPLPGEGGTLSNKLRACLSFVQIPPCWNTTDMHEISGTVRRDNEKGVKREPRTPVANAAAGEGGESVAGRDKCRLAQACSGVTPTEFCCEDKSGMTAESL